MSRFFRRSERAILYIAAGGKCSHCREPLTDGWHADHVRPYSKGGKTDVVNGQALCPACNLSKGNSMSTELREWQQRGLEKAQAVFDGGQQSFTAVACPGAGKTIWALTVAWDLVKRGKVDLVVVVVPSDELRRQWAANTSTPLELRVYSPTEMVRKPGYNGIVTTYQALGGSTAGMIRMQANERTLVIFDEVHHAADQSAFGTNIRYAFDGCGYRLLLTGTPWRTRQFEAIPYVRYDEITRELIVDHAYGYGAAVRDRVCRPIKFFSVDGKAAWRDAPGAQPTEVVVTPDLDVAPEDKSSMMRALLEGDWLLDVLTRAHTDLMSYRREYPDAGGLVVAKSQEHAYMIQGELEKITGRVPTVVVSDSEDSKDSIERFRKSRDEWIIAVRMIAEGVDIPRLMVGVYATNYQTKMFFTQVVGRFVRVRPGEYLSATMYVPPTDLLLRYAQEIEQVSRYALEEQVDSPAAGSRAGSGGGGVPQVEILGSESMGLSRVIASGQSIDGDAVADWQNRLHGTTIPPHYAAELAALDAGMREPQASAVAVAERKPRNQVERDLRKRVTKLANQIAFKFVEVKEPQKFVNAELCRVFKTTRGDASIEQLEAMEDYLKRWKAEGCQP